MSDDRCLEEKYADLLDEGSEAERVRVIGDLDALASSVNGLESNVAATIRTALMQRAATLSDHSNTVRDSKLNPITERGARAPRGAAVQKLSPSLTGWHRALRFGGLTAFAATVVIIAVGLAALLSRMEPSQGSPDTRQTRIGSQATGQGDERRENTPAEQQVAGIVAGFLDARLFLINSGTDEEAQRFDTLARSFLAPEYNARVPDLEALDIPTQTDDEGRAKVAAFSEVTFKESGAKASVGVEWESGDQRLARRFHLVQIDEGWKINGLDTVGDNTRSAKDFDALGTPVPRIQTPLPEGLPALDRLFGQTHDTRHIIEQDLGEEFTLSQTVGGFTVSVRRAYADGERTVIGIIIEAPRGREDRFAALQVSYGRDSVIVTEVGGARLVEHGHPGVAGNAELLVFKTPELGGRDELRLRLVVPKLAEVRESTQGSFDTLLGPYPDPCDQRSEPVRCYTVEGPFTFDFTVPVEKTTPDYETQDRLAAITRAFLTAWDLYMTAGNDEAAAGLQEERARALLTPAYNARVGDLGDMDVPLAHPIPGDNTTDMRGWCGARDVEGTRGWVECGYSGVDVEAKKWRRYEFELTDGRWRIDGIGPAVATP